MKRQGANDLEVMSSHTNETPLTSVYINLVGKTWQHRFGSATNSKWRMTVGVTYLQRGVRVLSF